MSVVVFPPSFTFARSLCLLRIVCCRVYHCLGLSSALSLLMDIHSCACLCYVLFGCLFLLSSEDTGTHADVYVRLSIQSYADMHTYTWPLHSLVPLSVASWVAAFGEFAMPGSAEVRARTRSSMVTHTWGSPMSHALARRLGVLRRSALSTVCAMGLPGYAKSSGVSGRVLSAGRATLEEGDVSVSRCVSTFAGSTPKPARTSTRMVGGASNFRAAAWRTNAPASRPHHRI